MSLEDFQKQCFRRFGPPESNNPVGELLTLRQNSRVEIYQRRFQEKLARADELIPEHLHVAIFMAGLDDSIKLDVQLLKPPNLSTAMSVARALEQKQQLQKGQQSQISLSRTVNLAKFATSSVDSFNTKTRN